MPTPRHRLPAPPGRRRARLAAVLLLLAGGATALAGALAAQELPPPVQRPVTRKPAKPEGGSAPAGAAAAGGGATSAGPSTALLICDVACELSIDGEPVGSFPADRPSKLKLQPGQHLMRATNATEGCLKEQIVEGKGGQTVLKVDLKPTCSTEFDRTMALLWLAQQDFTLAGRWVESVPAKEFRSASPVDTAKLYASHQTMQQQLDTLKTLAPSDAARQRIAEEMKRIGENANKYIEVLTQAITDAKGGKEKKGLLGIFRHKDPATKGLDTTLEWSFETWSTLKASPAFVAALPGPRRAELGLGGAPPYDLGVEYYNFQPDTVVFVRKGSVGANAGFAEGDRLVAAEGKPLSSLNQLLDLAASGQRRLVMVRVDRKGKPVTVNLQVPGGGAG